MFARELRKLTQQDLANRSGVQQSAIGNYESGLRKSSREVIALARALEVRPEWLQNGSGGMELVGAPRAAREPSSAYGQAAWPFTHVTPAQYAKLSDLQKSRLEGYVQALVDSAEER